MCIVFYAAVPVWSHRHETLVALVYHPARSTSIRFCWCDRSVSHAGAAREGASRIRSDLRSALRHRRRWLDHSRPLVPRQVTGAVYLEKSTGAALRRILPAFPPPVFHPGLATTILTGCKKTPRTANTRAGCPPRLPRQIRARGPLISVVLSPPRSSSATRRLRTFDLASIDVDAHLAGCMTEIGLVGQAQEGALFINLSRARHRAARRPASPSSDQRRDPARRPRLGAGTVDAFRAPTGWMRDGGLPFYGPHLNVSSSPPTARWGVLDSSPTGAGRSPGDAAASAQEWPLSEASGLEAAPSI